MLHIIRHTALAALTAAWWALWGWTTYLIVTLPARNPDSLWLALADLIN